MLSFVYGHEEEMVKFVTQFAGRGSLEFGNCKSIGVIDEDGKLIAGIVYHNYDDGAGSMEFGAAAVDRRWLSRATLRRMFEYPFVECGCQLLYTWVRADNEHLLSQVARLNFSLFPIPRMYGRDDDAVLCTLTDDQWLDSAISKRIYRDVRGKEAA